MNNPHKSWAIVHQNIQGLTSTKVEDLKRNTLNQKIDLLILTEHKISKKTKSKSWEYNLGLRRCRSSYCDLSRNNGVLFVFSNSLYNNLVGFETRVPGHLAFCEVNSKITNIIIVGVYMPSSNKRKHVELKKTIFEQLLHIIETACSENKPVIIYGDFNAALSMDGRSSKQLNENDKRLISFVSNNNITILSDPKKHTWSARDQTNTIRHSAAIDHILGRNINLLINRSTMAYNLTDQSDHEGTSLTFVTDKSYPELIQRKENTVHKIIQKLKSQPVNSLESLQNLFITENQRYKQKFIHFLPRDDGSLQQKVKAMLKQLKKDLVPQSEIIDFMKRLKLLKKEYTTVMNKFKRDDFKNLICMLNGNHSDKMFKFCLSKENKQQKRKQKK